MADQKSSTSYSSSKLVSKDTKPLYFPKELLISCLDNIDLFLLHLPDPKSFIQKILDKDDLELFKQLTKDIQIIKDILHIKLKFNEDIFKELVSRSFTNISIYLKEEFNLPPNYTYIFPFNEPIKFLIDIREMKNAKIYIEYSKWAITMAKELQICNYIQLSSTFKHNDLFVNKSSIKKILTPFIISDEYKLYLDPKCDRCNKLTSKLI